MTSDARPLIDKFWAGTATPAEQQVLLGWLDAEEAAGRLALPDEDSDGPAAAPAVPLSPEQAARVLRRLHWRLALDAVPTAPAYPARAAPAPRPRLRTQAGRTRWVALAALVLALTAGLGWWLTWRLAPSPPLARQAAPLQPPPAGLPAAGLPPDPALIRRTNAGPAPLRLPLPDGSVATLEAHSTLTYQPFGPASRELSLRGAALFAVAHDAARPFTVEAGGFRTTALGTRFRVVSRAGGRVSVRLLRGRVVVRAADSSRFVMQPQYLTPGRELSADTRTQQVRLGAFDSVATAPRRATTRALRAAQPIPAAAQPPAQRDNQGRPAPVAPTLRVWVCTWCRHTYTSPTQPTSFEPDKCPRNPGKAHAWHKKYPALDAN